MLDTCTGFLGAGRCELGSDRRRADPAGRRLSEGLGLDPTSCAFRAVSASAAPRRGIGYRPALGGKAFLCCCRWWRLVAAREHREAASQSKSGRRVRRPGASPHPAQRPRVLHAVLGPWLFEWHQRHTAVTAAVFPLKHLFLF